MHYSKYTNRCCLQLSQSNDAVGDQWIEKPIEIERLCAEIDDTFSLYDVESCDFHGGMALQSLVKAFSHRLEAVRKTFPSAKSKQFRSEVQRGKHRSKIQADDICRNG